MPHVGASQTCIEDKLTSTIKIGTLWLSHGSDAVLILDVGLQQSVYQDFWGPEPLFPRNILALALIPLAEPRIQREKRFGGLRGLLAGCLAEPTVRRKLTVVKLQAGMP